MLFRKTFVRGPCTRVLNEIELGTTDLLHSDPLLGRVVGDDEAEPEDEDDAERDWRDCQPARSSHAIVDAGHDIRPAPKILMTYFLL